MKAEFENGKVSMPKRSQIQPEMRVAEGGLEGSADVHPERLNLLEEAASGSHETTLIALLSPFDPLMWDRQRAGELFDFDYTIECYTPAAKRRYGYFSLPILRNGRLDPKAHRAQGIFEIKAVHLEAGVPVNEVLIADLAGALPRLDKWHWEHVLHQKTSTHAYLADQTEWRNFCSWVEKAGHSLWLEKGWLTKSKIYPLNLLARWKIGEKEPWCLATNFPDKQITLRAYAHRMLIEEMFGDIKDHGLDLERTMLHHTVKLSRLTLAIALLYGGSISARAKTIQNSQRDLVNRKNRRDLSIFQIGLRFIERQLVNELPCPMDLCVYQ